MLWRSFKRVWRFLRRALFGHGGNALLSNGALAIICILLIGEIGRWYFFTVGQAFLLLIPFVLLVYSCLKLGQILFDERSVED